MKRRTIYRRSGAVTRAARMFATRHGASAARLMREYVLVLARDVVQRHDPWIERFRFWNRVQAELFAIVGQPEGAILLVADLRDSMLVRAVHATPDSYVAPGEVYRVTRCEDASFGVHRPTDGAGTWLRHWDVTEGRVCFERAELEEGVPGRTESLREPRQGARQP